MKLREGRETYRSDYEHQCGYFSKNGRKVKAIKFGCITVLESHVNAVIKIRSKQNYNKKKVYKLPYKSTAHNLNVFMQGNQLFYECFACGGTGSHIPTTPTCNLAGYVTDAQLTRLLKIFEGDFSKFGELWNY